MIPTMTGAWVNSYNKLASHYDFTGNLAKAEAPYQAALKSVTRLAENDRQITEYQVDLAVGYRYLGKTHYFTDRKALEDEYLQKSSNSFEDSSRPTPTELAWRTCLLSPVARSARYCGKKGNHQGAVASYMRGIELMLDILKKEPQNAQTRESLIGCLMDRAEAFVRLGEGKKRGKTWIR